MRPHSEVSVFVLAVVAVVVAACGTRIIRPGQYPRPGEGIAFIRVKIEGLPHAKVHIICRDGHRCLAGGHEVSTVQGSGREEHLCRDAQASIRVSRIRGDLRHLRGEQGHALAMFRAKYADLVSRYAMEPDTR
jgi:hypothetical protein